LPRRPTRRGRRAFEIVDEDGGGVLQVDEDGGGVLLADEDGGVVETVTRSTRRRRAPGLPRRPTRRGRRAFELVDEDGGGVLQVDEDVGGVLLVDEDGGVVETVTRSTRRRRAPGSPPRPTRRGRRRV